MKNILITVLAFLIIVAGVGGFLGGMKFQDKRTPTRQAGQNGFQGRFGQGQNGQGANIKSIRGQIISADDKSITVKAQDGSTTIVILSNSASITQSTSADKSDLAQGKEVAVFGTGNSDGSVTAQSIQLNPQIGRPNSPNTSPTPNQ